MSEEEPRIEEAQKEDAEEVAAVFDLSKKKKKKKKKEGEEDAPNGGDVNAEVAAMFDLTKKKKKKKKKDDDDDATAEITKENQVEDVSMDKSDDKNSTPNQADRRYANYTYQQMLDRVVGILQANNPELAEKRRHSLKPPQLMRVGTKKTLWVNFQEICKMLNRSPEHLFQFFMAELGTEGSIDGTQRLVIRGKYVPKYIESLLRKYIVEYVTCQMCRSPNTTLTKDSVSRLYFIHCQDCGSSRSVAPIRAGFHATSRADRRAARK
mmetsp:Transcript_1077/g.1339  ORF Transcript_1077/g.1339 Transcript_1077/m.1339 type:complete len:266 (+) Transcript_1077:63-860(+)|eukprot:CAMPEP_0197285558 /NCGR_PEP_ID=MMETSP0890-20130614/900_1 /TAXON_ID=44058 ORGANISM="Aureoumbra lagunensis, Strain CCMP1510" /NCGR_SAMPLE_ID=MMETSP0890 /ASSEMBLY_ACC=CAM_ASM_000533 /LENGTH=265 /DNA_ID=CAMNT_0042753211 /DNA_START=51 /DNA_END=848 /DNA_ORIENTATION=-